MRMNRERMSMHKLCRLVQRHSTHLEIKHYKNRGTRGMAEFDYVGSITSVLATSSEIEGKRNPGGAI